MALGKEPRQDTPHTRTFATREPITHAIALPTSRDGSNGEVIQLVGQHANQRVGSTSHTISAGSVARAPLWPIKKAAQTGPVLTSTFSTARKAAGFARSVLFDGATSAGGMVDVLGNDMKGIGTFLRAPLRIVLGAVIIPGAAIVGAVGGFAKGVWNYPWRS